MTRVFMNHKKVLLRYAGGLFLRKTLFYLERTNLCV